MKTILVTGCNGQLGHELQDLAAGHPSFRFLFTDVAELDICNEDAVRRMIDSEAVDVVMNCAAYTAVDRAESDAALARRLNAEAPAFLAKAVAQRGGTMLQVSTDYVFDGCGYRPYTEDMPTGPQSVYGRTKLEGEEGVMRACPAAAIVRTAWLYSTYGNNFVKTMLRLGREREELGVVADQIGTPTYARDLAQALLSMAEQGVARGVYHFTDEGVASWYDFTKAIFRLSGNTTCRLRPLHTEDYPTAAQRPHYSVLDKTKIKQTYGISIPHWEDSLAECIKKLQA